MAIKIKNLADTTSAHDEAAAAIETEVAQTLTKSGVADPLDQKVDKTSEPVNIATHITPVERIDIGMSFKMPVASYTMLEFSVRRSVPFDPVTTSADTVFDETKAWVEAKLNALIEEQQPQAAG
jgi:hypothetical protein